MNKKCQCLKKEKERLVTQQENLAIVVGYLYVENDHRLYENKTSLVVRRLGKFDDQLQKLLLPREFWVSRSPCSNCSKILIEAYAHSCKPTIFIGDILRGKKDNIERLQGESFKFKPWNLQEEYKEWMETFQKLGCCKSYGRTKNGKYCTCTLLLEAA